MGKSARDIERDIAGALALCDLAEEGLWSRMRRIMDNFSDRPGFLRQDGTAISPVQLARVAGCTADELDRMQQNLAKVKLISVAADGTYHSDPLKEIARLKEMVSKRVARCRGRARPALRNAESALHTPDVTPDVTPPSPPDGFPLKPPSLSPPENQFTHTPRAREADPWGKRISTPEQRAAAFAAFSEWAASPGIGRGFALQEARNEHSPIHAFVEDLAAQPAVPFNDGTTPRPALIGLAVQRLREARKPFKNGKGGVNYAIECVRSWIEEYAAGRAVMPAAAAPKNPNAMTNEERAKARFGRKVLP